MNTSASFLGNRDAPCGDGVQAVAAFNPTGRTGAGGIWEDDATHNFGDKLSDSGRLVCVDINRSGYAGLFKHWSFHREGL